MRVVSASKRAVNLRGGKRDRDDALSSQGWRVVGWVSEIVPKGRIAVSSYTAEISKVWKVGSDLSMIGGGILDLDLTSSNRFTVVKARCFGFQSCLSVLASFERPRLTRRRKEEKERQQGRFETKQEKSRRLSMGVASPGTQSRVLDRISA